jgi:nicotinamidase-related amidase
MVFSMASDVPASRSPELLSRTDSGLLVVDVQEKLIPLIPGHRRLVWNIRRLLDAASTLAVFATGSEQYPTGLGPTVPDLANRLGAMPAKTTFSCRGAKGVFPAFHGRRLEKLVVAGIETHVCILQTVLDALADGFRVHVVVDAVAARHAIDHETALRRMEASGATLTTTETTLFEWCEAAGTPQFKSISQLIRETPPA